LTSQQKLATSGLPTIHQSDSLKSLASNGYGAFLTSAMTAGFAHFGAPVPLQVWVNWNIGDIDKNLNRA
jgi:hypothetical protein